jgi:hypothetical protein
MSAQALLSPPASGRVIRLRDVVPVLPPWTAIPGARAA